MAQSWTDDVYASGHVGDTDLQNMENNFTAIKSLFSGGSAPPNAVAGMPWFDTTQKVQKQRNAGNSAWIGLMHGDTSEKRLVYRDAAMDGYARDSGVTDKVLALKGGSTYTTGGATAGSWTLTGFNAMVHKWYNWTAAGTTGQSHNSAGTLQNVAGTAASSGVRHIEVTTAVDLALNADQYTDAQTPSHTGADRIAAATCILIYLDL